MLIFLLKKRIKKLQEKIKLLEELRDIYEELIEIDNKIIKEYQILLDEKIASVGDTGESIQGTYKGTKK